MSLPQTAQRGRGEHRLPCPAPVSLRLLLLSTVRPDRLPLIKLLCWLLLLPVDDGLRRRRDGGPIIVRTAPRRAYDYSRM